MDRWPHQIRGVQETLAAINDGCKRILLTSPTGGGKTRMALDLADEFAQRGLTTVMYTNRRMLVSQTAKVLENAGVDHGIRAAGHDTDQGSLFQVSSIQTEHSRVTKRGQWELTDAKLVLLDEAHLQTGPTVQAIIQRHVEAGAVVVGITATPLDLGEYYDKFIVAGTNNELRECGAIVPAIHYGPDEPDLKAWKKKAKIAGDETTAELSENQVRKAMMTEGIFGRVMTWFEKLNPEHKPTILFAPGVAESLWFAQQFEKAGIKAAHLDGTDVWVDGKLYATSPEAREDVLSGSRRHDISVLCNRFVLREGIDCPWLAYGIFATIFGSLQSYLQSGGRILRAFSGLSSVSIQDHGGNWWRHGSLNADREWSLDDTQTRKAGVRADRCRAKKEHEPTLCPRCFLVLRGRRCPCGWERTSKRSRFVVQTDGTLKQMHGDVFQPSRMMKQPRGPAIWERFYWAAVKNKKGWNPTFKALEAWFAQENNWNWPDRSWPLMPREDEDFYRHVIGFPMDQLIPKVTNAPAGQV